MKNVHVLRVVVASPSDVQAERDLLAEIVIPELNHGVAADRGVRLDVYRWETDAFPRFHARGPQGGIDEALRIKDCDLLIGIFWKRFGTPVGKAKSGTEHEIRQAYDSWTENQGRPEIMIYFNQEPCSPENKRDLSQWRSTLEFRRKFPREGLWWPYLGTLGFERESRSHLTRWLLAKFPSISRADEYDYYECDLEEIDDFWDLGAVTGPETVVLVTGCYPIAELLDRPVAELLRSEIDRRGSPPSRRRGIVVGDQWWFKDEKLRDHPVVSIGGEGSNAVTSDLLAQRQRAKVEGYLWSAGEGFPQAIIAGGTARETMYLAERFVKQEEGLTSFLKHCWQL